MENLTKQISLEKKMKHKLIMEAWRKFIAEDIDLDTGSDMETGPAGAQQYKFSSNRARGAGSHARTSGAEGEKTQDAEIKKGSRALSRNRFYPLEKVSNYQTPLMCRNGKDVASIPCGRTERACAAFASLVKRMRSCARVI